MRYLREALPTLDVPWVEIADLPTPVERLPLPGHPELYIKRDDLTARKYGGNKVRTLEPLCGLALARGAETILATGAYGSNHGLATILHAPTVGLRAGALMFPQPRSGCAAANFRVSWSHGDVRPLPHWSTLPFAMWRARRGAFVMPPGGATPRGTLGYVSAALELAFQIEAGELPVPHTIVLPVGSTCTSAGLLAGLHLAAAHGIGFTHPPTLLSVRVTPWPVTAPWRILALARRTAARIGVDSGEFASTLRVTGAYLGRGYGHATEAGRQAIAAFRQAGVPLDTTYSAKAAAACLDHAAGPTLFWSTKNSARLPAVEPAALESLPPRPAGWLARCPTELPDW